MNEQTYWVELDRHGWRVVSSFGTQESEVHLSASQLTIEDALRVARPLLGNTLRMRLDVIPQR